DLACGDAVLAQHLGPGAGERDLADGCRRLAVLELERTLRQLEHRAAERDRPGRNDNDVAFIFVETRDVRGERNKPSFPRPARLGVDQERRADLDHDAAEVGEGGGFGGHGWQKFGRLGQGERLLYSRLTAARPGPRRGGGPR